MASKDTRGKDISEIKTLRLNPLDVYLDTANPRHEPLASQSDIIAHLLKKEKVRNLARAIAAEGLSPLELFAIIQDEGGNYVAVEGNRRLCSIILLNNPSAAPDGERNYFKSLADGSTLVPREITGVLFPSREAADIWIERRHDGEQEGIGTRKWDAEQKARHKDATNKPNTNALALSIIDYAVKQGFLPAEGSDRIITTVARYFGNPYFRKTIGIASGRSDAEVILTVTYDEFDRAIEKFFTDLLAPKPKVTSRSDKAEWEAYAAGLVNKGYAPSQHIPKTKLSDRNVDDGTGGKGRAAKGGGSASSTSGRKGKRSSPSPDKRRYIVPSDFHPPVRHKILRRVLDEMRNIPVDDFPLAVSFLTRAFLENLYSQFHEKMANFIDTDTNKLLGRVIKLIDSTGLDRAQQKALGALTKVQSNEHNVFSPKTLGANAHANHYPNPTELKREWDNVAPILEYMLQELDSK